MTRASAKQQAAGSGQQTAVLTMHNGINMDLHRNSQERSTPVYKNML